MKTKNAVRMNIVSKLIVFIGIPLLIAISCFAYFNISYQNKKIMKHIISGTHQLSETIRLGTHYAMTLNSRDDINQIIHNIGKQPDIEKINIYNKLGEITYSNIDEEIHQKIGIETKICDICHRSDPPLCQLDLDQRTRIFQSPKGHRSLGILTPICNEEGCSSSMCHFHPEDKKILGLLDVEISLKVPDEGILAAKKATITLAVTGFVIMSAIIFLFVHRFINVPIQKMIDETVLIARGDYESKVEIEQEDEIGQLAEAINLMRHQINEKQTELNEQRDEFRTLFEDAPCLISVQDRDYQLLRYNRRFKKQFDPKAGSRCYQAYKNQNEKCHNCPVEKTFRDGKSHFGETSGIGNDGVERHWMFITSPIKNARGDIISAIEMSIDITDRIRLEKKLESSEKKYQSVFNNIPNPAFVLNEKTLQVVDCNQMVSSVYGFSKNEVIGKDFNVMFTDEDKDRMDREMKTSQILNQIRHKDKDNKPLYVDIWISPSEYEDQKVLLVTTSDITKRLETEQELMQACKMATLGEMSTGIAHELNQPLSVIKTASDFIIKKKRQGKEIDESIHETLLNKINSNVDRASKIIEHMRNFARKSDTQFESINLNTILKQAHDIFSQQLKVRGIEVVWELAEPIPDVKVDPGRIEQVFINLLINARDAIEEKWQKTGPKSEEEQIIIRTVTDDDYVIVTISDTGIGLSDEIKDKIFEPFFTTKEVGKGTGIGLSISYGIIKECGGHIEAAADDNTGGTIFSMRFPVS
jgi:histidine kinase